ncbi:MAG TPA: hypothetical protein VNA28_12185 [Solirubrobacteraceae bacterium]|nr:hypothetical protein [Solirubrobacteraceae bacterium]
MQKFAGKITSIKPRKLTSIKPRKITSIKPLYLIVAVLVAVLIIAGISIFATGGGDDASDGPAAAVGVGVGDVSSFPGSKRAAPKRAPVVRGTGVLDEARREGRLAVAQARGTIKTPTRIAIRVSAAPKQTVTVNYQLGCFRNRRVEIGRGSYRTKPPNTREVPLPMRAAESCIVTAGAQLTRTVGAGRVAVRVISR